MRNFSAEVCEETGFSMTRPLVSEKGEKEYSSRLFALNGCENNLKIKTFTQPFGPTSLVGTKKHDNGYFSKFIYLLTLTDSWIRSSHENAKRKSMLVL